MQAFPGGKFHSGFHKRSKTTVAVRHILDCAEKADCETIITCGHSLGGAVSSVTTINLLLALEPNSSTAVHNITFGAPFFTNERVRKACQQQRPGTSRGTIDQNMLHYVSHKDIVPGLLSLGHTAQVIKKHITGKPYLLHFYKFVNIQVLVLRSLDTQTNLSR